MKPKTEARLLELFAARRPGRRPVVVVVMIPDSAIENLSLDEMLDGDCDYGVVAVPRGQVDRAWRDLRNELEELVDATPILAIFEAEADAMDWTALIETGVRRQ
jgi:hypothetical protein